MSKPTPKRGGPPEPLKSIDWGAFVPAEPADDEAWQRELSLRAREEAAYARQRHLEHYPKLDLTDAARRAIIRGEGLKDTKPLETVRAWHLARDRTKPALMIAGTNGAGKSTGVGWLLAECGGAYWRARDATRVYALNFGDERELLIAQLTGSSVFVLDDVGLEEDPLVMSALLCELFDVRKSRSRRSLLTCNMRQIDFLKRYPDQRLRSRAGDPKHLSETLHWRSTPGPDLRLTAREEPRR